MPVFSNSNGELSIYDINEGLQDVFSYNNDNANYDIVQNKSLEFFEPNISENDSFWLISGNLFVTASGDSLYGTPGQVNSPVWNQPTANAGGPYFGTDTSCYSGFLPDIFAI